MKLLGHVDMKRKFGKPYTIEELDNHEDSRRIWATLAQCKREATEAIQLSWGEGYWRGLHDR